VLLLELLLGPEIWLGSQILHSDPITVGSPPSSHPALHAPSLPPTLALRPFPPRACTEPAASFHRSEHGEHGCDALTDALRAWESNEIMSLLPCLTVREMLVSWLTVRKMFRRTRMDLPTCGPLPCLAVREMRRRVGLSRHVDAALPCAHCSVAQELLHHAGLPRRALRMLFCRFEPICSTYADLLEMRLRKI
jgi:hypothetical protein